MLGSLASPVRGPPHRQLSIVPRRPSLDPSEPSRPTTLDWDQLRATALQRLRSRLRFTPSDKLEDLAQEVVIAIFQVSQREPLQNPDALLTTICHRVIVSHVRRMKGPQGRLDALPDTDSPFELPAPDPQQEVGADMLEMFRFVVCEHFRVNDAPCLELARAFFTEQNWAVVSEQLGLKHNTVIKRWSRCMASVREVARNGQGPVWEWARAAELL